MDERFARLPSALEQQSRRLRLVTDRVPGGIPALLAHPDWSAPAPVVIWMHGRTVSKDLDPGRYLRWIRAGIAACAIDLPGHGDRLDETMQDPSATMRVVKSAIEEIDHVVEALADPAWRGVFDLDRMGIGGMSAGGMVTLRRLCDPHPFRCAAVESTAGDFSKMPYAGRHDGAIVAELDPMRHIDSWRPLPLLALHSEADEWVPVEAMRSFTEALRARYTRLGAKPDLVEMVTWPSTGAPAEHSGFGRVANDAKNLQVDFLKRHLLGQQA
jgi:dienelactone hydrolase